MDVIGILLNILGWFNPGKWLTMFAKWWLRKELKEKDDKISSIQNQLESREREQNLKIPTYCPRCNTHTMDEISRDTRLVMRKCSTCGFQKSSAEHSRPDQSSDDVKTLRVNRPTQAINDFEL